MGLYRDEAGLVFEADDRFAQSMGYAAVSPEEEQSIYAERGLEARGEERGALGTVNAALTGIASGATLGLSDMALAGVLTDDERERLFAEIEAHPVARFGGEAVGAVATGIAAPGSTLARTPAGYLSNLAARQVETGLARGGFRGVGQALGAMGTEGAAQSVGQYLGHTALADKEVTVEGLSGALGTGFAFGAAGGGAALGVVKGTIAARRLYSRFMDGRNAQSFESAWTRSMQEALDATDMTAQKARQRLDDLGAAKLEAMRYRNEAAAMTREEQIRAQAAGRATDTADETATVVDDIGQEGFVGPEPLIDVDGIPVRKAEGPTSVFQRPPELVPEEGFVGPEPLIDVDGIPVRKAEGPTSVFKRPAEVAPEAPAAKAAEPEAPRAGENFRDSALDGAAISPQIPPGATPKPYKGRNPSNEIETMLADKARFDRLLNLGKNVEIPKARGEMLRRRFNETFEEIREARTADLLGAETAKIERELEAALQELDAAKKDFTSVAAVPEDFFDPGAGAEFARKTPRERVPLPDDLDMAGMQKEWRQRDKTGGNGRTIEALDAAHEEALARARTSTDPRDVGTALQDAQRLEELLERVNVSATPDVVADDFMKGLEGGVMKIERFEKAIARAAELVGEDAHPSLQAIAKGVNAAEKDAVRKVTERATRAVEDAEEFGPIAKTPKERVTYAKERQLEAQRSFDEISVQEKEAKRAAKKAGEDLRAGERAKKAALKLDAKAAGGGSKFGAAEGLGALELLDLPGMPSVSDLPVVGPLLGAWLKYRTLKAAIGRKMGRVPATPDARVAAAAAATRDRIARAVDRSFKIVERGGQIGMKNAPKLAGVLAARIYDDGEPDAKKGAPITELAAVRARELAAYVATPGAIERDVRRELIGVTDPDLIAAAEQHRRAAMQWLLQHAPKGPEQGMMRTVKWAPSPAQAMSFARRWEAVNEPAASYERLAHEQDMISLEAAEALRAVYPQMFAQAQQRLMERIAETPDKPVPYRKRVQMTLLYQLPLDAALSPDNLKITQSVYERKMVAPPGAPATPPAPSVAQPTNVTALYQNPLDNQR